MRVCVIALVAIAITWTHSITFLFFFTSSSSSSSSLIWSIYSFFLSFSYSLSFTSQITNALSLCLFTALNVHCVVKSDTSNVSIVWPIFNHFCWLIIWFDGWYFFCYRLRCITHFDHFPSSPKDSVEMREVANQLFCSCCFCFPPSLPLHATFLKCMELFLITTPIISLAYY